MGYCLQVFNQGKRLLLTKGTRAGRGSVAGGSSLINSDEKKCMFYFCMALYLSTGANYPALGTFAGFKLK